MDKHGVHMHIEARTPGYKYVRIQQNKTQTRSASCRSRVTNERDIRFVNGNDESLYIYNLSEKLSILFNYCYKVKSKNRDKRQSKHCSWNLIKISGSF